MTAIDEAEAHGRVGWFSVRPLSEHRAKVPDGSSGIGHCAFRPGYGFSPG